MRYPKAVDSMAHGGCKGAAPCEFSFSKRQLAEHCVTFMLRWLQALGFRAHVGSKQSPIHSSGSRCGQSKLILKRVVGPMLSVKHVNLAAQLDPTVSSRIL